MTNTFNCPKCGLLHHAEVDLRERIVYHDEKCDCGHEFTQAETLAIYDELIEGAYSMAVDRAHDLAKEHDENP